MLGWCKEALPGGRYMAPRALRYLTYLYAPRCLTVVQYLQVKLLELSACKLEIKTQTQRYSSQLLVSSSSASCAAMSHRAFASISFGAWLNSLRIGSTR